MAKGDIVLITFPFTDLSGSKLRPAVVLIENSLDCTVCFITSQVNCPESHDIVIQQSIYNGLKKPSLIRTNKIATLDKSLVKGLLGRLTEMEIKTLNGKLKILLQITD